MAVSEAASGKEGLTRIAGEHPDAVILDLNMPDMSGFEVLKQLEAQSAEFRVPVLVCSSKRLSPEERREIGARADAVISKQNVSRADLIETLEAIMRAKTALAGRRAK
jgi:CheY-like chemotaxis protein